jgi:hypothetical protein
MMIKNSLLIALMFVFSAQAQLSPAITSWLQNTTQLGMYYVSGNSTPITNKGFGFSLNPKINGTAIF